MLAEEEGAQTPVLSEKKQEINTSTPESFDKDKELQSLTDRLSEGKILPKMNEMVPDRYSLLPSDSKSVICKLYFLIYKLKFEINDEIKRTDLKINEEFEKKGKVDENFKINARLPLDRIYQIADDVKNEVKKEFLAMKDNDIIELVWCLIEKNRSFSTTGSYQLESVMGCYLLTFLFEAGKKDLIKKISCDKIKNGTWKEMRSNLQKSNNGYSPPFQEKILIYFDNMTMYDVLKFIENNRSTCKYGSFGRFVPRFGGSKKRRRASRRKPVSKKRRIRRKVTKSRRR